MRGGEASCRGDQRDTGPRSCRQEGGAERVAGHRRHALDLRVLELSDESRVAAGQLEHAVDGRRLRERLRIDERQLFLDAHRQLAIAPSKTARMSFGVWAGAFEHSGGASELSLPPMPDQLRA